MDAFTVKVLDADGAEHLLPAQSVTHRNGKLTLVTPSGATRTVDVVAIAYVMNAAGQNVAVYRAGQHRSTRPQAGRTQHNAGAV